MTRYLAGNGLMISMVLKQANWPIYEAGLKARSQSWPDLSTSFPLFFFESPVLLIKIQYPVMNAMNVLYFINQLYVQPLIMHKPFLIKNT